MSQESAARTTGSVPEQRSGVEESAADHVPTGARVRRVPLARLLSLVVLSPAQALLVAVRLLDATHVSGASNGTRPGDARLWAVALTPSGDVEVARAQAGEGGTVTEFLEQLSENARRLPAHPRSEQLVLLRRLEAAAAEPRLEPGACARELEGALAEVLGTGARQRLSGQLAALVSAFAHIAPTIAAVPVDALDAPRRLRAGPHRAAPSRSTPSRPRPGAVVGHRRVRNRRLALIALALATALAGSGYVRLRGTDDGTAGALGSDTRQTEPRTSAPSGSSQERVQPRSRPRPGVETLAGRRAGAVTGVEVQKVADCTPGALCPVTVTVRFRPASAAQPVTWKVGAARSCEGDITWSPPITVTAQPGWTRVYASSSVPIPQGRAVGLVALTTAPARAQSPPVPITGSSLGC